MRSKQEIKDARKGHLVNETIRFGQNFLGLMVLYAI